VDYDAIAAHFLTPLADPVPAPAVPSSHARILRDAVEPIATIGWWARAASEEWSKLGLGFFDGYVWGRAAALGADVSTSVVVSAFGCFSPALLGPVYAQGRATTSRDSVLAARERGATRGLQAALDSASEATRASLTSDVAFVGDRLLEVLGSIEPGPRHLFGGLQSVPLSDNPYARVWRGCELYREHRGDSHLAACVGANLGMAEMNVLTEVWLGYPVGEYSGSRGFSPEELQVATIRLQHRGWLSSTNELTVSGRAAREAIEATTDAGQQRVVDLLAERWEELVAAASRISEAVLGAHAAPADPRKRAAG
jgi:hypothetical protein